MDSLMNSPPFPHNHKHNQNAKPEPDHRLLSRFAGSRPQEFEQLPCPRCNSTNTKFCYYNNYNLSQPRHFCKSCRRYWTRGGTLRDVPIGGGTRKSVSSSSNKRPRTSTAVDTQTTTTNSGTSSEDTQTIDPVVSSDLGVDLNEAAVGKTAGSGLGCFWSSSGHIGGGIIPSNVYGLGYGLGLLEWPMEQIGGVVHGGTGVVSGESLGCNTWQIGGGVADQGMLADGDYFTWPELAISTPAKAMK